METSKNLNDENKPIISDRKFLSIVKKMFVLEYKMITTLYPIGWQLPMPLAKSNNLLIDIIKKDKIFTGNIILKFVNHPTRIRFTLSVTKQFDDKGYQYSYKFILFNNKKFSFFKNKIVDFTKEATNKYEKWDVEYIIKSGLKEELK